MPSLPQILFNDDAGNTRAKVFGIYGILLVFLIWQCGCGRSSHFIRIRC